jgi:hypothetical protein
VIAIFSALCCNPARTAGIMIIIAIALALFLGLAGVTLAGAREVGSKKDELRTKNDVALLIKSARIFHSLDRSIRLSPRESLKR